MAACLRRLRDEGVDKLDRKRMLELALARHIDEGTFTSEVRDVVRATSGTDR